MSQILRIERPLTVGLDPADRTQVNAEVLEWLSAALPSPRGLMKYLRVSTMTFVYGWWPFPRLHCGSNDILMFYAGGLERVTDPGSWTREDITTYDPDDPETPKVIPYGDYWHIAHFGDFLMAFNGKCVLYYSPSAGKWLVETGCYAKTGCNLWGRGIFANFTGYDAEWGAFWASHLSGAPGGVDNVSFGPNTVAWSSVLGGDLLQWFQKPNDASLDLWHRNQGGFMEVPWPNGVSLILPHVRGAVVYGENGVGVLTPVSTPYPTFAFREVLDTGIAGPMAAEGSEYEQVFLDKKGTLWRIDGDLHLTELGYRQHLADLVNGDPVVTYDAVRKEFRICTLGQGFLLNQHGLAGIPEVVSSVDNADGVLLGAANDLPLSDFSLLTNVYDLGTRVPKTITALEIGCLNPQSLDVRIYGRAQPGQAMSEHGPFTSGADGTVPLNLSMTEFQVGLTGNVEDIELDGLAVRWSLDKQYYRSLLR